MILGPFSQLVTMAHLPLRGALHDDVLEIIADAGIMISDGLITNVGSFDVLCNDFPEEKIHHLKDEYVAFPGMIDVHTHLCWAGSRAGDYAARVSGKSYLEIAEAGGGIMDTVRMTRAASKNELIAVTVQRANTLLRQGVTTIEVKSGYGLTVADELKILEAIQEANAVTAADLVSSCLAAHIVPIDFHGYTTDDHRNEHSQTNHPLQTVSKEYDYLRMLTEELLPEVKARNLSKRVDIFVEKGAFSVGAARDYLLEARKMGFDVLLHGDQFTNGTAELANEVKAISMDHLEAADIPEIITLANGNTIPVALPGASLGLGEPFAPARQLLDAGCPLVIASDWNPGSAPMGHLLTQAAILGAHQHLSMAEVWAAITYRAAASLRLTDRGVLQKGMKADLVVFQTNNYKEVLYRQGELRPAMVLKNGVIVSE
jgi:imidazolonepropionase